MRGTGGIFSQIFGLSTTPWEEALIALAYLEGRTVNMWNAEIRRRSASIVQKLRSLPPIQAKELAIEALVRGSHDYC